MITINPDDLTSDATRSLISYHLVAMRESSPPGQAFALDLSGWREPGLALWSAWDGDDILGIGGLKALTEKSGELKSMRTAPAHLRKGVGQAILEHLISEARRRDYQRLSLETGSGAVFEPAIALYRKRGFTTGDAFSNYVSSAFNQFMHLDL